MIKQLEIIKFNENNTNYDFKISSKDSKICNSQQRYNYVNK